jgi:release factor glutamine methyltransferase
LALAHRFPQAQVTGLDVSEDALDLARENGLVQGLEVDWLHRDFLRSWADLGAFDVVISNPPYIPQRERLALASHVIHHEPALALFVPDERPLLHYEALTHAAEHGLLHPGGLLAMECHTDFVAEVAALGTKDRWRRVDSLEDLQGRPRFVLRERWPD